MHTGHLAPKRSKMKSPPSAAQPLFALPPLSEVQVGQSNKFDEMPLDRMMKLIQHEFELRADISYSAALQVAQPPLGLAPYGGLKSQMIAVCEAIYK